MDFLIAEERQKPNSNVGQLKKIKEDHLKKKAALTKAIQSKQEVDIDAKDIFVYQKKLFNLKYSGECFRQSSEVIRQANARDVLNSEKKIPIKGNNDLDVL